MIIPTTNPAAIINDPSRDAQRQDNADDLRIDWPELLPGTDALEAMRRALPENELEQAATSED
jgi:hypothetical protein